MTPAPVNWFEKWFNEVYLKVYAHRDEESAAMEAAFALKLLKLRKDDSVLDLCCGAGRHLKAFHRMKFTNIQGVDLSPTLLKSARGSLPPEVALVRSDMRSLPFACGFRAVVSYFTSFGYFAEETEDQKVLLEIHRVLQPGGVFLLDLVPRSVVSRIIPRTEREVDGLRVVEERVYSPETHRIEKTILVSDGNGQETFQESVRVYSYREISRMLAESGLCLTEAYGDFSGEPYRQDSPRMILLGVKDHRDPTRYTP